MVKAFEGDADFLESFKEWLAVAFFGFKFDQAFPEGLEQDINAKTG